MPSKKSAVTDASLKEGLLTEEELRWAKDLEAADRTADAAPSRVALHQLKQDRDRNILLLQIYTFVTTIGFSISQWNIFDAYLQALARSLGSAYSNSFVGVAESLGGVTSLVLAIPVGILVDRHSRTAIC
eukprot:Selendium_serpulae@DN5220_c0_g1_i4.p1